MKIAFRTDASLQIGTGHVMRCLTLAEVLRDKGAECLFLCREHEGNLLGNVRQRGFEVAGLPACNAKDAVKIEKAGNLPLHAAWLGCDWQTDACQSTEILSGFAPDWLIVDHYALDAQWEKALKPCFHRLMVIDDLADRPHVCDLLLDQNLGSHKEKYNGLVPDDCRMLIGPRYALLRPEFSALRSFSLRRRKKRQIKKIQITMGGVDKDNITALVLDALTQCDLDSETHMSVVLGGASPWVDQIRQMAARMPWPTEVAVNVTDMAQRMAETDLAIGAAGSTSWERCCLGVPSILFCLADNQVDVIHALVSSGAALSVSRQSLMVDGSAELQNKINSIASKMTTFIEASKSITSGRGCDIVAQKLFS